MEVERYPHSPTLAERKAIQALKREANRRGRERWIPHEYGGRRDQASFTGVETQLSMDFVAKVAELSRTFKGARIEVLFEGCGFSSFPEELTRRCRAKGIKVRVYRSDLYHKRKFRELAAETGIDTRHYHSAAPEELVRVFGPNRFHLVVSRSGGLTYTPFGPLKGIVNVTNILKKGGGEAHIVSEDVERRPLPIGRKIWLNDWKDERTPVGQYLVSQSGLIVEQAKRLGPGPYIEWFPILRIVKNA